jgi:rubrerythrin
MSNPAEPTDVGQNRTGIATSPLDARALIEGTREAAAPRLDLEELSRVRLAYSAEVEPVGSMPPPASLKGAAKAALKVVQGQHPMVFLDELGERLAFERTGTRLYDALLVKVAAAHHHQGGPTRQDIEEIRDDELRHAAMVKTAIESLGADPTVVTPAADLAAVASQGLVAVLTDPRTTLTEALKAILIAELADSDAWVTLQDLAERLGHAEIAAQFRAAVVEEEQHLTLVRSWLATSIETMAGIGSRPADGSDGRGSP